MGFAIDGESNIIFTRISRLTNRFQNDIPRELPVVHDLPHAYNLILRDALKSFSKLHSNIVFKRFFGINSEMCQTQQISKREKVFKRRTNQKKHRDCEKVRQDEMVLFRQLLTKYPLPSGTYPSIF